MRPRFTEFSDDGALAFVSGENDGSITVADARTHKVLRTIKLQGDLTRPVGMALSHDGKKLYTVTGRGKKLLSLDVATGKVLASVEVGPRPWVWPSAPMAARCSLPMAVPTMLPWWMPPA